MILSQSTLIYCTFDYVILQTILSIQISCNTPGFCLIMPCNAINILGDTTNKHVFFILKEYVQMFNVKLFLCRQDYTNIVVRKPL